MKVRTDRVSKLYQPLFDEKLIGVRHAENGRLYAVIENTDKDADEENKTREVPVGALPFADVQVGPVAVTVSCFRHNMKGDKEHDWNEVHVGAVGGFR